MLSIRNSIVAAAGILAHLTEAAAVGGLANGLVRRATSYTSPNAPQQTGTVSNCDLWYDIASGDTCATVEADFGITSEQFLAWNPAVSSDCSQNFWVGYAYCVGVSSGSSKPSTTTAVTAVAPTTKTSPSSVPTFTGMPCTCDQLYTIQSGDTCPTVEKMFGITSEQFLAWNPAVSSNCETNFWVGYAYCVGVSGATSCPTTTSSPTTAPTTTSALPTTAEPTPPSPTFPGIPCSCDLFWEVRKGDTCETIEKQFGITSSEFFEWNPAVDTNCTLNFYIGYSYCVKASSNTAACTTTAVPSTTKPANTVPYSYSSMPSAGSVAPHPTATGWPPKPQQSGIPSNCQQYYQATPQDTCMSIQHRYSTLCTMDQFLAWNPAVGANCTNLYVNYYYCVSVPQAYTGLPNATTQNSGSPGPTGLPTTGWNTSIISMLHPTFTGAASGCPLLFPAPNNESCSGISSMLGVSVPDLEAWNTGINCSTVLFPSEMYCVANPTSTLPAPTTTAGSGGGSGPQPQQSGTVADCSQFWFVGSADNCTTIAASNNVTVADLESWNPSLGSDCKGLKSSYYVCVSGAGSGSGTGSSSGFPTGSTKGPTTIKATTTTTAAISSKPAITSHAPSSSSSAPAAKTTTTSAGSNGSVPQPAQSGISSNCVRYYLVESGDTCIEISVNAGISTSDFYSWNPAVGTSCNGL